MPDNCPPALYDTTCLYRGPPTISGLPGLVGSDLEGALLLMGYSRTETYLPPAVFGLCTLKSAAFQVLGTGNRLPLILLTTDKRLEVNTYCTCLDTPTRSSGVLGNVKYYQVKYSEF